MTLVRFYNSVICSLLPDCAHTSMAQPCKLEAAVSRATAENERLPRRMETGKGILSLQSHRFFALPRTFRLQGGSEPTLEARAEMNLFKLCLARRRKTEGQSRARMHGYLSGSTKLAWEMTGKEQGKRLKGS